jgi:hypothetical protein
MSAKIFTLDLVFKPVQLPYQTESIQGMQPLRTPFCYFGTIP